jgi:hypothetical protein
MEESGERRRKERHKERNRSPSLPHYQNKERRR